MAEHVLGFSRFDRGLIVAGFPALGAGAGYVLPAVAGWLLTLPWVPFAGPARLAAALGHEWGLAALSGAGFLLGGALAMMALHESLKVTVTDTELVLTEGGRTRTVARHAVDAVFVQDKRLVVLDRASRQLVCDKLENADGTGVEEAFRAHGYPWRAGDPYAELYRRWVPDLPDLPAAVNAMLAARAMALTRKSPGDAEELRDEVQKLGYTVRDDGTTQHWRPLVRS